VRPQAAPPSAMRMSALRCTALQMLAPRFVSALHLWAVIDDSPMSHHASATVPVFGGSEVLIGDSVSFGIALQQATVNKLLHSFVWSAGRLLWFCHPLLH
jgi:hypothetical protein